MDNPVAIKMGVVQQNKSPMSSRKPHFTIVFSALFEMVHITSLIPYNVTVNGDKLVIFSNTLLHVMSLLACGGTSFQEL